MHALARFLQRNRGFLFFLLGMLAFRSALADWNTVPTGSMQPTILIGDRIVVDRTAYDPRLPTLPVTGPPTCRESRRTGHCRQATRWNRWARLAT